MNCPAMKIPTSHLQPVNMPIRLINLQHLHDSSLPGVRRARRPMGKLITATGRWPERFIAIGKAGQIGCQIKELLSNEMHHLPFPLDATVDRHHARSEHDAPAALEEKVSQAGHLIDLVVAILMI